MTRQRGYSIVEIAIVLTVILMMSSFLAGVYFQFEDDDRNEQAARQVELIKEAVADYAAANKTSVRYVDAFNMSVNISVDAVTTMTVTLTVGATVRWTLPAGRPYLPCPDIDGDGYEDRVPPLPPSSVISINTAIPADDSYVLEVNGGCASSRGILPWRTLNTPGVDPWGQRFTYRSAGIFSNSMTGFDQHTRANSSYKSRPLFAGASGALGGGQTFGMPNEKFIVVNTMLLDGTGIAARQYFAPAVILSYEDDAGAMRYFVGEVAESGLTMIVESNFADFSGALTTQFGAGQIVGGGVPFVVVSHGKNGYGGARSAGEGYVCREFPSETPPTDAATGFPENFNERVNANRFVAVGADGDPYDCPPPNFGVFGGTVFEYGFVPGINYGSHTGQSGRLGGYDDIVGWLTMPELVSELKERGALPARPWPPLGLELE